MTTYLTSKIKLVYCFSRVLSQTEEQYTISLSLLKKSIELSSKIYAVKIYTDEITFEDLKDLNVETKILKDLDLIFTDDFKVLVLDLLNTNEIFIDSDVLIYSELTIDSTKDIVFDFVDKPSNYWYRDPFNNLRSTAIEDKIHRIGKPSIVPNLGFLKFNNQELLFSYKIQYSNIRKLLLEQAKHITPIHQFSIILGQYVLGAVLELGKYSYFDMRSNNEYW